jgi:hypothetical protein
MRLHSAARREAEAQVQLENLIHYGNAALVDPTIGRALRIKIQLPGESKDGFQTHHAAIMRDFRPVTSAEVTILESFIRVDWELVKHRILRDVLLFDAAREKIKAWVIEQRLKMRDKGAAPDGSEGGAQAPDAPRGYWKRFARVDQEDVEAEVERILDIVLENDPEEPSDAHEDLNARGLYPMVILGEVMRESSDAIRFHEKQIQALEKRRSEILNDWIRLRRALVTRR